MRREDREIIDYLEIESILHNAIVCRIGLAGGDEPYIVPLCFGYEDRTIYLHSALAGKKISMLKKNSRCCFEVDQCDNLVHGERPCAWGCATGVLLVLAGRLLLKTVKKRKRV
jgi:nitroimidazol reductase NimA-like FMN-containing flavoprotein (pyridoxamine 5'-phosphate oxidase superfamily)